MDRDAVLVEKDRVPRVVVQPDRKRVDENAVLPFAFEAQTEEGRPVVERRPVGHDAAVFLVRFGAGHENPGAGKNEFHVAPDDRLHAVKVSVDRWGRRHAGCQRGDDGEDCRSNGKSPHGATIAHFRQNRHLNEPSAIRTKVGCQVGAREDGRDRAFAIRHLNPAAGFPIVSVCFFGLISG